MVVVDSWPFLEISDWPKNFRNLNRMLIQKKRYNSNGKLWYYLVPMKCQVGIKNNYSDSIPVQVEFTLES